MKKFIYSSLTALSVAAFSNPADALLGLYVGGSIGASKASVTASYDDMSYNDPSLGSLSIDDFEVSLISDIGLSYSFVAGFDIPVAPLRIEGEYYKMSADLDKIEMKAEFMGYKFDESEDITDGSYDISAVMANLYFTFPMAVITGYVGAGIGQASAELSIDSSSDETDEEVAYQFMTGVEFDIPGMPLKIAAEYKLFLFEADVKMEGSTSEATLAAHNIMAKARFEF